MTTIEYNIEDYINDADAIVKYVCNTSKMWSYYNDLYSCAMVGLVLAKNTFDSTLEYSFQSYVKYKVYQAVIDEIRELFPNQKAVLNTKKQIAILEKSNDSKLSDEQIADKLNLTLEQYYKLKYKPVDRLIQCRDMSVIEEAYSGIDIIDSILLCELCDLLRDANSMEYAVVNEIYINGLNSKDTANVLNVSEHVVSRAHSNALDRLRNILNISVQKPTRRRRHA